MSSPDQHLVVASVGGWEKPSTSYRIGPLARAGYGVETVSTSTIPSEAEIRSLCSRGGDTSILILRRVLPRRPELQRLRDVFGAVVFDMDDAIYATPPQLYERWLARLVRSGVRFSLRGSFVASSRARPLRSTLRGVDVCVVGNSILGDFAKRHATEVVEIPTTTQPVAPERIPTNRSSVIAWVGVPANLQYLNLVSGALQELHRRVDFQLRVISSRPPQDFAIPFDFVPWSPAAAEEALLTAKVGIAPLTDSAWTRGKCAFRAIQYGAHALPTVASPVGITPQVVIHGMTGYLARSQNEWVSALERLIQSPGEAAEMGARALTRVTRRFADEVAVDAWRVLLSSLQAARSVRSASSVAM